LAFLVIGGILLFLFLAQVLGAASYRDIKNLRRPTESI
jgi:hypothetical protein